MNSLLNRQSISLAAALLFLSAPTANANLIFTQTVDGWFTNTYTWAAQLESIQTTRGFDPVGTVKTVWARVVQKNGSEVSTAVFSTTMTKTATGLADTWDVSVPAGSITDSDFWDASVICIELVKCGRASRITHNSIPSDLGSIGMVDLAGDDLDLEPETRYASLDTSDWDDQAVRDAGFDFAVYAYLVDPFGPPLILNHLDEVALSAFTYDQTDAFGSGQPFDINRFGILGVELDFTWDFLAKKSNGLQFFEWQVFLKGGMLFTDQGDFQIVRLEPLTKGWRFLCPADYNEDGELNFFDISEFLSLFNQQDPEADFNGDGDFNFFDISAFLQSFSEGCP
jgi:hypothetical protein